MEITYNNRFDYFVRDYVTFTGIPNILKVKQPIDGNPMLLSIEIEPDLKQTVYADGQYYITLLGETITNVMTPSDAKNKRFYINADTDSTTFSMCQAFRNCSSLNAQFLILHNGNEIDFISRTKGGLWGSNYVSTNIPNEYITISIQNGSIGGGTDADIFNGKVYVDVYKNTTAQTNYITTLEKNYYGNECAFDVSPVLATFSEYGKTIPYHLIVNKVNGIGRYEGEVRELARVSGNTAIGYHCNQSFKMLEASGVQMLMENDRNGKLMKRYVYGETIPYSVLVGPDVSSWNVKISYKNSINEETFIQEYTDTRDGDASLILNKEIELFDNILLDTYYVDIILGNTQNPYRFNVIKPLKATEYYQRVEWYNEYGGISFFDFTAAKSETDGVSPETYEKNIFDYHENISEFEKKIIYKNNYDKTVKLTSHLMEEEGKWIFNSLAMSKKVWTYIDGFKYYIIPKTIEVVEDGTYNNIYTATLTYSYSDI